MAGFHDDGATDYRKVVETEFCAKMRRLNEEFPDATDERKKVLKKEIEELQSELRKTLASIDRSLF